VISEESFQLVSDCSCNLNSLMEWITEKSATPLALLKQTKAGLLLPADVQRSLGHHQLCFQNIVILKDNPKCALMRKLASATYSVLSLPSLSPGLSKEDWLISLAMLNDQLASGPLKSKTHLKIKKLFFTVHNLDLWVNIKPDLKRGTWIFKTSAIFKTLACLFPNKTTLELNPLTRSLALETSRIIRRKEILYPPSPLSPGSARSGFKKENC